MNFDGTLSFPFQFSQIPENNSSADEQAKKRKLFKKQEAISSLVKNIQRTHSPVTTKKLCAKLSKEVNKLSHLVEDPNLKTLTESERSEVVKSLKTAQECLKSTDETAPSIEKAISLPNWLKDDIEVSAKQGAHIAGDTFAKAANLEGGTAEEMLSIALELLAERPDFISKTEWKSLVDLLRHARTIDREVFGKVRECLVKGSEEL